MGAGQSGYQKWAETLTERVQKFLEDSISVHGHRYDYSKVEFKKASVPVIITCPIHGDWKTTPNNHKRGSGCPTCGAERRAKKQREEKKKTVINDFRKVHGDRYDYSKVEYQGTRIKVTIICPDHGDFLQTPSNHKSGAGCRKCGYIKGSSKNTRRTRKHLDPEKVIQQFREVHGDRYDYSQVDYVSAQTKVTIICPDHGEFEKTPNNHKSGQGCPDCSRLRRNRKLKESRVGRRERSKS